jgi:hypothetical protein
MLKQVCMQHCGLILRVCLRDVYGAILVPGIDMALANFCTVVLHWYEVQQLDQTEEI